MAEHQIWSREIEFRANPALALELAAARLGPMAFLIGESHRWRLHKIFSRWVRQADVAIPPDVVARYIRQNWLPGESRELAIDRHPGVVGLSTLQFGDTFIGLVNPLTARWNPDGHWEVPTWLPFTTDQLQNLFHRLVAEHGGEIGLPERYGFAIHDSLGEMTAGPSMTIAGLLALIAAGQEENDGLLSSCCAIVQPRSDLRLEPVGHVAIKLKGFCREYGRGRLLIRTPDCAEADRFGGDFDEIWTVDSLSELGRQLDRHQLFRPFLSRNTITQSQAEQVIRLVYEKSNRHEYNQALELAQRLNASRLDWAVQRQTRLAIHRSMGMFLRHLGRYREAIQSGEDLVRQLKSQPELTSYDEMAAADVEYAASLFDGHRFEESHAQLSPWLEKLECDPLILSSEVRIWIMNTIARGRIQCGDASWEALLRESLRLQRYVKPQDVERTRSYLIYGYLRERRLEEARRELEITSLDLLDPASRAFRVFLLADLARRDGQLWHDSPADAMLPGCPGIQHPWALYFQATGRQPLRDQTDARRRLSRAAQFLRAETPGYAEFTLHQFLAALIDIARAARGGETAELSAALAELETCLANSPDTALVEHYRDRLAAVRESTTSERIDRLLDETPYF